MGDLGFKEGQLVYLKDHRHQGQRKIQDVWSPILYQVVKAPTEPGRPYTVTQADGNGNVRQVNRFEMRASQLKILPILPEVPHPPSRPSCPEHDSTSSAGDILM